MCLAIPAKIVSLNNAHAIVDIMGIQKEVNIELVSDLHVDEYVMVHAGFAINKIDNEYYDFLNDTLKKMLENQNE